MMRLIDANALMPNAEYKGAYDLVSAYDIANAPAIDPVKITTNTYTTGSGTVNVSGKLHLADDDDLINRIMERLNFVPTIEHKCHNCGGSLEIKSTEHIFKCPFCNSVYAIGTKLVNDRG